MSSSEHNVRSDERASAKWIAVVPYKIADVPERSDPRVRNGKPRVVTDSFILGPDLKF
jgi:hypothetical protein